MARAGRPADRIGDHAYFTVLYWNSTTAAMRQRCTNLMDRDLAASNLRAVPATEVLQTQQHCRPNSTADPTQAQPEELASSFFLIIVGLAAVDMPPGGFARPCAAGDCPGKHCQWAAGELGRGNGPPWKKEAP